MNGIQIDVSEHLTPFEKYDLLARRHGWLPTGLSDTSRPLAIGAIRQAFENCRAHYPITAFGLYVEIGWRETLRHIHEINDIEEKFRWTIQTECPGTLLS
jgi:hypothetical protein